MVKTAIDINTKIKVKNIEVEEYEKIMNVWRACMLFFEREIRKLNDRNELTSETLKKLSSNIDFTELLRMNFLSIKDPDRMRLVKLTEVAEAIQKVQQMSVQQYEETSGEPYSNFASDAGVPAYENINNVSTSAETLTSDTNPISNILNQNQSNENELPNEIRSKDHLKILQRNTASSVVELRKLMYQNIQKIRQTLSDESV